MENDHGTPKSKKSSKARKWTKVGLFIIVFDVAASIIFIIWKGEFIMSGIFG